MELVNTIKVSLSLIQESIDRLKTNTLDPKYTVSWAVLGASPSHRLEDPRQLLLVGCRTVGAANAERRHSLSAAMAAGYMSE